MAVFLNRNKRPQAAPIEVAELLSEKPPPSQLTVFPTVGRGGSVSRRDHNLLTGNRAHLAWGRKLEEKDKPIPSYSSGERGLGGEALLLEKRPLPPESSSFSRL